MPRIRQRRPGERLRRAVALHHRRERAEGELQRVLGDGRAAADGEADPPAERCLGPVEDKRVP